jgi:hypothetical protein
MQIVSHSTTALVTALIICVTCLLTSGAFAVQQNKERCSFVQCVNHCIKNGEAPKGTYRGGGGCGKLCHQKGCN